MNRYLIGGVAFCLLSAGYAAGQSMVSFPQGDFSCTIDLVYHKPPGLPPAVPGATPDPALIPAVPKTVEVQKINEVIFMSIKRLNNRTTQVWYPGALQLTLFRDSIQPQLNSYRGRGLFPDVFYLDKEKGWYEWADEKSFKEEMDLKDVACRRYSKAVLVPAASPGLPPLTVIYQLWLDAETLRPIAFDDGDVRYNLKFGAAPEKPPSVPAEITQEIARYEELLAPAKRPQ